MKIKPETIDLIVYDFDGVLTDNRVLVLEDGREGVWCNRSDGLAINEIKKMGLRQIILSTETNKVVSVRAKKLGIEVLQGAKDKVSTLQKFCQKNNVNLKGVVYIGNDLNDFDVMNICEYSLCPLDAAEEILSIVSAVIPCKGGYGVARRFYDMIKDE